VSYSLYLERLEEHVTARVASDFGKLRAEAMKILQEEAELEEIVRLVGVDALSVRDRLTLETAKSLREDFLHQNAYHEVDTYTSLSKQHRMMKTILKFHHAALAAVDAGVSLDAILDLPVRDAIARMKYIPESEMARLDKVSDDITKAFASLTQAGGEEVA